MKNYNLKLKITRTDNFSLPLHIAMQNGLYLLPSFDGVWHIVSEGSKPCRRFFLHCLVFPADYPHWTHCHFSVRSSARFFTSSISLEDGRSSI